jgi:cytosine permease
MRKPWTYSASIYMGMTAVISASMAGGGMIAGLTISQSIIALILGLAVLILVFFVPLGKIGASEGLNTYIIGEAAFGKQGSVIATSLVVTAIPCIAWYGIQVSIAAFAIAGVFNLGTMGGNIFMVVFGLLFAVPPILGIKSMAWLNYVSIPVMVVMVIVGVTKSINILGGIEGVWAYAPETNQGILWGINLEIGMIVVGASFIADYTRWQKDKISNILASGVVGLYPFTLLLTVAGMIMSLTAVSLGVNEPWNIVEVMIKIGMPAIALVLIFLLQWTTAITSIYSSGLALTKAFGGKRYFWSIASAVLGILFSLTGIINYFLGFVSLIGIWVSPVAGVIIADYYVVSKNKLNLKEGIYWPGIISWLIGGIVAWKIQFFIPAVNAVIISGLCYIVYHKLIRTKNSQEQKVV